MIEVLFLAWDSSVLASELSSSSSFSDRSQKVRVSADISSGKSYVVMVGLAAQIATLLAQRNG